MLSARLARPLALSFLLPSAALAQALEVRGQIEAVTVYRGQALITRFVDIPAAAKVAQAAGEVREVVVTDLPPRIRPESLQAESSADLSVRSVRFRQRPLAQDTREEVRTVDVRILEIGDKQAAAKRKTELITEHKALLTSLEHFVAPTATVELTHGILNAETLQKLTTYLKDQRDAMAEQELALAVTTRTLVSDMDQAQRERQQLAAAASRTAYEAVILLTKENPGAGSLRLRYLVDDATWTPSYNVRAGSPAERGASANAQGQISVEYEASIQQMSGEDWPGVAMTLSTATPSLIARPPTLEAMTITLTAPQPPKASVAYADARREIGDQLRKVEFQRAQNQGFEQGAGGQREGGQVTAELELDKNLNRLAESMQVLDLVAGEKISRDAGKAAARPAEEGLSVTYSVAGKTTLPSRADRQLIQIAAIPLKADFVKIATPVLTGYIYDEARAVNTSSMVLLAGPYTAYSGGAFVGSGDLPTVAIGQSLTTGFGIDSSLHTARELVERQESTQGGNRIVDLTYRLSVENFGGAPASIRLLDRLPKVKGADIRVTLVSASQEPVKDESDLKIPKSGILRWDLTVPPQAIGAQATTVEYKFRLEYDKQMTLAGLGG